MSNIHASLADKHYLTKTDRVYETNHQGFETQEQVITSTYIRLCVCTHGLNAWDTWVILFFGYRNLTSVSLVCPTSPSFTLICSYLPQYWFWLNNCTDIQKACLPLFIHLLKVIFENSLVSLGVSTFLQYSVHTFGSLYLSMTLETICGCLLGVYTP